MSPEGLLLVDKARGWTSHDVVAVVRRRFPRKTKVGHSGTLDPMATGLLVLLVGSATKTAALFQGLPKVYSGRVRFGVETDTADMEGKVLREEPVPELAPERIQAAFDALLGPIELPPPAYSAVKVQGKPLYAYARAGVEVVAKPRPQCAFEWRLLDWKNPEASFRMRCSGGTYVRSLAVAAGKALGLPAAVSELRRESVGPFQAADAVGVEAAKDYSGEQLAARLIPPFIPPGAGLSASSRAA